MAARLAGYQVKVMLALGEVARRGETGLLLLSADKGEQAGSLSFTRGMLARFRPGTRDEDTAPTPMDTSALRRAITRAVGAGEALGYEPQFTPERRHAQAPAAQDAAGSLSAADIALDICHEIDDDAYFAQAFAEARDERLGPPSSPPASAPQVALRPDEGFLLSRVDGSLTLRQILDTAPLPEAAVLKALFGLRAVGLLTVTGAVRAQAARASQAQAPSAPAQPARSRLADLESFLSKTSGAVGAPAQPSSLFTRQQQAERDALLARCRMMAGRDLYAILEVERGAGEAAIRRAYYGLARRFHPDRLLKPHLEDIHRDLEGMFAAITDAYNTLSSPTARAEYERELSGAAAGRRKDSALDKIAVARDAYLRGRKAMEAGELYEAIRLFESAVESDPGRAEYYHYLGVCQGQNPRWRKKAEENLLAAIKKNPGAAQSYLELARVYRKGGLERRSQEMYEQVLRWDPAHAESLAALGRGKDAAGSGLLRSIFKKE